MNEGNIKETKGAEEDINKKGGRKIDQEEELLQKDDPTEKSKYSRIGESGEINGNNSVENWEGKKSLPVREEGKKEEDVTYSLPASDNGDFEVKLSGESPKPRKSNSESGIVQIEEYNLAKELEIGSSQPIPDEEEAELPPKLTRQNHDNPEQDRIIQQSIDTHLKVFIEEQERCLMKRIFKLEKENKNQKSKLSQRDNLSLEHTQMTSDLSECKVSLDNLKAENYKIKEDLQERENNILQLDSRRVSDEEVIRRNKVKISTLCKLTETQKNTINEHKLEIEDLKNTKSELKQITERQKRNLKDINSENNRLTDECRDFKRTKIEKINLEAKLKDSQLEIASLNKMIQEYSNKWKTELERSTETQIQLNKQISLDKTSQRCLSTLQEEVIMFQMQIEEYKKELKLKEVESKELNIKITNSEEIIEKINVDKETYDNKWIAAETKCNEYKAEGQRVKVRIENLEGEIHQAKMEINEQIRKQKLMSEKEERICIEKEDLIQRSEQIKKETQKHIIMKEEFINLKKEERKNIEIERHSLRLEKERINREVEQYIQYYKTQIEKLPFTIRTYQNKINQLKDTMQQEHNNHLIIIDQLEKENSLLKDNSY